MRLGPGPVFVYEWLTTARRWQLYALRALFVAAILVGLTLAWNQAVRNHGSRETASLAELAEYGRAIYVSIVLVELTLVLLAAPAATAGAVCLDKARGTLDHVLATDLSNAEIVLGKLAVRMIPVLGLVACVLPVVALSGLLGGIDPLALAGSFLVAVGCAVLGCSLAMALSVWGRKTHEVLMMTYVLVILWLIFPGLVVAAASLARWRPFGPPPYWQTVILTNPYYLLCAPYTDPTSVDLTTFLAFLGVCLATSGVLVGSATVRIRQVALRQAGRPSARRLRRLPRPRRPSWLPHLPGPSLDVNPVAWREWHRLRPSWMMRIAWWLYAALGLFWIVLELNLDRPAGDYAEVVAAMCSVQVALGLLLLSVGAATSLAEERVRGSLDILLSTPISTRSILAGKWWGTFRQVGPVVSWPAVLGAPLLLDGGSRVAYLLLIGSVLASGAAITSVGLAMATWVSRLGRAVALCVTAYAVISIGWPTLIASLFSPEPFGRSLVMGSPAVAAFMETALISPGSFFSRDAPLAYGVAASSWIMIDLVAAAALFTATLSSFDRCLGRMPETGGRPDSVPRHEPLAGLILDP